MPDLQVRDSKGKNIRCIFPRQKAYGGTDFCVRNQTGKGKTYIQKILIQSFYQFILIVIFKIQLDLRIHLMKCPETLEEQFGTPQTGENADTEDFRVDSFRIGSHFVDTFQFIGIFREKFVVHISNGCKFDRIGRTVKQFHAQFLFKIFDLFT